MQNTAYGKGLCSLFLMFLFVLQSCSVNSGNPASKHVRFLVTAQNLTEPYTGRVYVAIAPKSELDPIYTNVWLEPMEIVAKDVKDWNGTTPLQIVDSDLSFKKAWPEDTTMLQVQAALRVNKRDWQALTAQGNKVSVAKDIAPSALATSTTSLDVNTLLTQEWNYWAKQPVIAPDDVIRFPLLSERLSEFYDAEYRVGVAVRLPKNYEANPDRAWPVLYYISGMGGNELEFTQLLSQFDSLKGLFDDVIIVSANAMHYFGHSVFANSKITGPWEDFFVDELVKYINKTYRTSGKPYLTGISSGGWSSLWLQIRRPETFAGVWSFVPDPVDFREFQQVDVYMPNANLYFDSLGKLRPGARTTSGKTLFYVKDVALSERVLGPGGQYLSFNYVFGNYNERGQLPQYFDFDTGEVDSDAIRHWSQFDIRRYLQENWEELAPGLTGKLNIYAGQYDNFYLEDAVKNLRDTLADIDAEVTIEVMADKGHAFKEAALEEMLKEMINSGSNP
ncbi:hypothetical protein KUL152_01060 [Tenacibaculum sp. KUL152]|nr:hypothetical protein KUL152_01060 [Tenacibaculum sp. KUL152]